MLTLKYAHSEEQACHNFILLSLQLQNSFLTIISILHRILRQVEILDSKFTAKEYNDEYKHFKPQRDGQIDLELQVKKLVKNQRRIMYALEVKSYSYIYAP